MQTQGYTLLIVKLLTHDANREQCNAVIECTDGDLRAHAQARLNVLDNIQNEAQKTIYTETPPAMVYAGDLQDWWIEKYGIENFHHIDFRAISEGKRQEWYAHANRIVENNL
jgi:hypothetical protein